MDFINVFIAKRSIEFITRSNELLCGICNNLLTNPTSVPCGCRFCRTCISNYLKHNRQSKCPGKSEDCNSTILKEDHLQTDHAAKRKILNSKVKCLSCNCIVIAKNLIDHQTDCVNSRDSACMYATVGCLANKEETADVESHLREQGSAHSQILIDFVKHLERKIDYIKADHGQVVGKLQQRIVDLEQAVCVRERVHTDEPETVMAESPVPSPAVETGPSVVDKANKETEAAPVAGKRARKKAKGSRQQQQEAMWARCQETRSQGNESFKRGELVGALHLYEEGLTQCGSGEAANTKDRAMLHQNIAAVYEAMGKPREGLVAVNKALQLVPRYEKALYRRSRLLQATGKLEDALGDGLAAAFFDDFKTVYLATHMDDIINLVVKEEADELDKKNEIYLPSIWDIKVFLKSFPSDPLAQEHVVPDPADAGAVKTTELLRLWRAGSYSDCHRQLQIWLPLEEIGQGGLEERFPGSPNVVVLLLLLHATLALLSCREKAAMKALTLIVRKQHLSIPRDFLVNALIKLGVMFTFISNYEEALRAYDHASSLQPGCPDLFYHRGRLFLTLGHKEKAMSDFDRAISLLPDFVAANTEREYCVYKRKVEAICLESMKKLLTRFSDSEECVVTYMRTLMEVGAVDEALEVAASFLTRHPQSSTVHLNLALIHNLLQNDAETKRICEESIKTNPRCGAVHELLSRVLYSELELAAATSAMHKAVRFSRSRSERMRHLYRRAVLRSQLYIVRHHSVPAGDLVAGIVRAINGRPDGHLGLMYPHVVSCVAMPPDPTTSDWDTAANEGTSSM